MLKLERGNTQILMCLSVKYGAAAKSVLISTRFLVFACCRVSVRADEFFISFNPVMLLKAHKPYFVESRWLQMKPN